MKNTNIKIKNSKSNDIKPSSPLFDDALPKKLKFEGVLNKESNEPKVHTDADAPVSPYIIHLSHEDNVTAPQTSKLENLAEDLFSGIEDFSDDFDDLEDIEGTGLEVDFQDLVEQLRNTDLNISNNKIKSENFRKENSIEEPSKNIQIISEKIDIKSLIEKSEKFSEVTSQTIEAVLSENIAEGIEYKIEEESTERIKKPIFKFALPSFIQTHHIAVVTFMVLALAIILPLHAMQGATNALHGTTSITDAGFTAINNLTKGSNAIQNNKYSAASADFERATASFKDAENSLQSMNGVIKSVVSLLPQTEKTYKSTRNLLVAGKELSNAGEILASAAEEIESQGGDNVATKITLLKRYTESVLPHIEKASLALEDVKPEAMPEEYTNQITELKNAVPKLEKSMEEFVTLSDTFLTILGKNQKMRYLVAFQNNTELRATGGFIGSFAEMDVLNGEIVNIHLPEGGTYDLQGQLNKFVASPKPISLLNARWEFHDANWFPDFPSSAKKMIWFYENAGGPTVDGVITINATLMPELLKITGPIEMPEYGRTIDSENFLFETQKIVEFEYAEYQTSDSERQELAPKKFLGELAPKILEKLEEAELSDMLLALDLFGEGLYKKDVQIFFKENQIQSKILELGWAGAIKQTDGDYLMVVNTNLGGGKTDTVIQQEIFVDTVVEANGEITNTVIIQKEHKGMQSALFEGLNNVDYIRLYVPEGSELIEASGFEIPDESLFEIGETPLEFDEDLALLVTNQTKDPVSKTDIWDESGKTVFGNWIQTKPGEVEIIKFKYKLPFTLKQMNEDPNIFEIAKTKLGIHNLENYTLLVQKQPGVITRTTTARLSLPSYKNVIWNSHSENAVITNQNDEFIRYLIDNSTN